jgi:hypothetical protein
MVFYELSEGHREAVTEELKSDIEQLRDDFAKSQYQAAGRHGRILRVTNAK